MTYDRRRVGFDTLLKQATAKKCDLFVWTSTDAQLKSAQAVIGDRAQDFATVAAKDSERADKEQQYYLYKSPLRFVPMTIPQRTRVNAALRGGGKSWRRYLSPRQLRWLERVKADPKKKWPVAQGVSLPKAAAAFERAAK